MKDFERRLRSAEPVRVCVPYDPAIDHSRSNVAAYAVERDPVHLVEREGERIQWFWIKRLDRGRIRNIEQCSASDKHAVTAAFRAGVLRVNPFWDADQGEYVDWVPEHVADPDKDRNGLMSVSELDKFWHEDIYDIGSVIWTRASLHSRRPVFFVPQVSSAHATGVMVEALRRVVVSRTSASQDNERPAATDSKHDDAPSSEMPGDAIAPAPPDPSSPSTTTIGS